MSSWGEDIPSYDWRKDGITTKQLQYIQEMQEFSKYYIPPFNGTTKGEAAEYINKYSGIAHTSLADILHDDAGDRR